MIRPQSYRSRLVDLILEGVESVGYMVVKRSFQLIDCFFQLSDLGIVAVVFAIF
jgi:hypothetical protein